MSDTTSDAATLQALLDRLTKTRLPRMQEIKKRVDGGECLTDTDIAFLKEALEDSRRSQQVVARNPEYHTLGVQIVQLYDEIVSKAVQNEKGA